MTNSREHPEVTLIIPNLNGRNHLDRCFSSLKEMDYDSKKLEFILVDNGSTDGSAKYMRYRFPEVRVIANKRNLGFCTACNLGARAASGELIVFLNNDMRVDRGWLKPLVEAIRSGETDCATSLILSWDGKTVNFGGAGANFHGIGFQEGIDDPDLSRYRTRKDILFACGGSMVIDRELFLDAGGFDEDFFAYFEDVDFGWRLWVMGRKVRFIPESVAYHHHSATARLLDVHKLRVLHIRNPLYAIFKNYEYDNLMKTLPAALLLTIKRTAYLVGLKNEPFRIHGRETLWKGPLGEKFIKAKAKLLRSRIPRAGMADLVALNDFIDQFKRFREKREVVQKARKRPDSEILPLFGNPFWAVEVPEEYGEALRLFADFFGFSEIFEVK